MEFLKNSEWMWSPDWNAEDKDNARIVLFRKSFDFTKAPLNAKINISADSRYKLYVNGNLVEVGPSKGDNQIWFYDTVNILPYLQSGTNIIGIIVLRYPEDKAKGNHSTFRTSSPGLYIKGSCTDNAGNEYSLSADESWKCYVDKQFKIVQEEMLFAPLLIHEDVSGNAETFGWLEDDFDVGTWSNALPYVRVQIHGAVSPGNLQPRTIPFMYRKQKQFKSITDIKKSVYDEAAWIDMLKKNSSITIPQKTEEIIEIDAGEEMTGYLKLAMSGGANADISILQSEAYVLDETIGPAHVPLKTDRTDYINGHLDGYTDVYHVLGKGTENRTEIYEPFWYRTFRFIQLKIVTNDEPLTIHSFDYEETGYPLEVKTSVSTSDKTMSDIWDISERTLRRCMHETYEDCPFYEQLQYAMDSRQQILYTYAVSADDRLARKCMDDFRRSQRYDGLTNCCYPNCNPNIIPGFSIYYILMVYDHMMYFGDKSLVKYHMPAIEGILDFFDRNLSCEGYVRKIGGLNMEAPFWSFIDWAEEWNPTTGVPPANLKGAITMESLLYIMGLQHAAKLAEYIDKGETAAEYTRRAEKVQKAILKYCVGENGLIQDGPGVDEYSQHCQVFAILTDTVDLETGKKNLLETVKNRKKYVQCTVAMRFYLFRALEKTDLYKYTDVYWEAWRNMVKNHATTCIESEAYARSECHAWGSLALYELPTAVLGVKPASPGYKSVRINPAMGYLTFAEGIVKTPRGNIKVSWKKSNDSIKIDYEIPENMKLVR